MTPPQRRSRQTYVGTRQELGPDETSGPDAGGRPSSSTPVPDPPPANRSAAASPPSDRDASTPPGPGTTADSWLRPGGADDVVLTMAGRFSDANAAAGYLGYLLDVAAAHPAVHSGDSDWWITADVRLSLARELVELSGGTPYAAAGDLLRRDRGWGPPPSPTGLPRPEDLPRSRLVGVSVADLVVAGGLRRRPTAPHTSLTVLLPAARASSLLRRTADLQLVSTFRAVLLRPLFADAPTTAAACANGSAAAGSGANGSGAGGGSLIQVRLRPGHAGRRHLPVALIGALDHDWRAVVLREVAEELLVQHDRQAPLSDRQLAALVDGGTWVIADPPFGCWSLEPVGDFADAASLITFGPAHRLGPGAPALLDAGTPRALPDPVRLTVVPSPRRDAPVDAVLLRDADLDSVRLMLEGHPLADAAFIVPGRDHHLLIAGGGIVERIPLGRYLTSAAPQPVYLPHGWRTDPVLPPSAYAELAARVPGHAVVLESDRTLVFDLALRRPVWQLWAGPLPPVDLQLPEQASAVLADVDRVTDPWGQVTAEPTAPVAPAPTGSRRLGGAGRRLVERLRALTDRSRGPVTWQQQALDAELSGDLRRAARLHEDNGSPLKAARLYERAALGDTSETTPGPAMPASEHADRRAERQ